MTVVQERPPVEAPTRASAPPVTGRAMTDSWLDTSDHKRLGLLFIYAALFFLLVSGVVALVLGGQQASSSVGLSASRVARLYGLHTQSGILLFLTAIWIGLATYVVPLQVGAGRLALPRLTAVAFWLYLVGGVLFLVSYLEGQVNGLGLTQSTPIPHLAGGANSATMLWIVSLGMVSLGFLLASASLLVTVVGLRTEGMTFLRVPAFSWASFVAACVTMVATPVFLGGLLLLGIDQRFGGLLLAPTTKGSLDIWQRTIWLYGRPDVYLITIVALGAASDIVATHARRPLLEHRAALVFLGLFAVLSLGSWAANPKVGAVVVPTYNVLTAAVAIPLGLTVLMWLGTMARARPHFHVSLLFVVGAIGLWVLGAANALGAGLHHVNGLSGSSAWVAGNIHAVVIGPPTLLAVGALYHWGPKMYGRTLSGAGGGLVFLLLFVGLAATGLAFYFLGYNGAPIVQMSGATSYQKTLYDLAEAGGVLVALGVLVLIGDLLGAALGKGRPAVGEDPYGGLTLEWATTSPPPPWGFDAVPEVRSEAPLAYLRQVAEAGAGTGPGSSAAVGGRR
ncbi:MAG TPA: cbb3-type cytochrome c oxidase subunit I [Acidimicrobiales bacterium]|nr:cbb3-type cytochrome c oxidase subunit I [Acidimicrobiales bacterium]